MNIEVFYEKHGLDPVDITVRIHDTHSVFYEQIVNMTEDGHLKFYCDWPFGVETYLDFFTEDVNILTDNYITITKFIFDDIWQSSDLIHRGKNVLSTPSATVDTDATDSNSLFYVGTLRYIVTRPINNWIWRKL